MVGTMRKNRIGWDKEKMNLDKQSERGSSLLRYDKVNQLRAGQWHDNKIVSFLTTLPEFDQIPVQRRKKYYA